MATALELRREPRLDDVAQEAVAEQPPAEHENVRVVVKARHARRRYVVDQRRANAGELVRGDRHADARPAQQHAARGATLRHRARDLCSVVGIIDRAIVMSTEVAARYTEGGERVCHDALGGDGRVVRGDYDGEIFC